MSSRSISTDLAAIAWLALNAIVSIPPATGASVEKLLMPGELTAAHAKLEESCTNCHDRTNARPQTALCVDCHKDVAADVHDRLRFHGRMPNSGGGECRACHTEHKGRKSDIVGLSRAQFDHGLTDFPLEDGHAALGCVACHKPGVAWRKAPSGCAACHQADDVHRGQFTQSCGDCHSALTWTGGRFDHDTTKFKLAGAHSSLTCGACHLGGRYQPTPETCVGCHATDDAHRGTRGDACAKCHDTKDWKAAQFDHFKETGYALLGAHSNLDCLACHRSGNYKDKIAKDCNGCHAADDTHARRFGPNCEDCHDNERWRVSGYDHAGRHEFALLGAHARIECHVCHTAVATKQKLAEDCVGCHRSEDPHGGKLPGGCDSCHGQKSWSQDVVFDHDLTHFPLLGLHRLPSCAQCHATLGFAKTPSTCIDCHARDDVHKGGLGKQCDSCHSPNGWSVWVFDHAKEAHFPLRGAHAKLQCADCHREPPGTIKMSQQCGVCHRQDDRHLGQYGAACDRCHTTYSWKGARVQ